MKFYSKLKVLMLVMILMTALVFTGCDSGNGAGDSHEVQDYSVDIVIEDIDEDEVSNLAIYVAGETHDSLLNYYEDNKVEYTLTLTESADISIAHEDDEIAFTPQTQSVDSSDDNISLTFRKGKYAESIEVLEEYFQDKDLRAIVLSGDIDFDEVDDELFRLDLERDLIIDGQNQYSIKGDGMIIIEMSEESDPDITFKNLTFEIGHLPDDWSDDEKHKSKEFLMFYGDGGKLILDNVTASDQKELIQNFIVAYLYNDSKLIINESIIDLNTTDHLIDLHHGGNAVISNNNISGEEQYEPIRIFNSSNTNISIENNDFSGLKNAFMFVGTEGNEYDVKINNKVLEAVSDINNDEKVQKFIDAALEIHQSLDNLNNMSESYRSVYNYGDGDDKVESIEFTGSVAQDIEIEFADDNLEQAVRDHIGQQSGPIYKGYVDSISSFEAIIGGIESLEGIEYFESLKELTIDAYENHPDYDEWNEISDLSPLVELDNLKVLQLARNNSLTDISELAKLSKLERIFMYHNSEIEDFSPLTELDNLYYLNLGNSGLDNNDLEVISEIVGLKELLFWDNDVTDISSVENLINLRRLVYGEVNEDNEFHNKVEDISPVKNLKELRQLFIPGTDVKDISPVEELNNLENLNVGNNDIKDFSPLEKLTNLIYLYLYNTGLESLEFLSDHTNLYSLDISHNDDITDLKPLKDIEWNFELDDEPQIYMINAFDENDDDNKKTIDYLKDKGIEVYYEESE